MTTTTVIPIRSWIMEEVEKPCETWVSYPDRHLCGDISVAALHMRFSCGRPPLTRLVCARHLDRAMSGKIICGRKGCSELPQITWSERIRGSS